MPLVGGAFFEDRTLPAAQLDYVSRESVRLAVVARNLSWVVHHDGLLLKVVSPSTVRIVRQANRTFRAQLVITASPLLLAGQTEDVDAVWVYAWAGDSDFFSLVQNSESTAHLPTFKAYQVTVLTGSDLGSLVQRRVEFVATEEYRYSRAKNLADAGGALQRQVRIQVAVLDTGGNVSETKTLDVRVVS